MGTLEGLPKIPDADLYSSDPNHVRAGQRRCPNPKGWAHIFFAFDTQKGLMLVSYPAERIDFETTNVPASVVSGLEEAIACHANRCFVAAALMVRKTLEELCRDRGATGDNLKERIKALGCVTSDQTKLRIRLLRIDALEAPHGQKPGQPYRKEAVTIRIT